MDGQPRVLPRGESTHEIRRAREPEILEGRGCEARRLAVRAHEDELLLESDDVRVVEGWIGVRVDAPFEDGPRDMERRPE